MVWLDANLLPQRLGANQIVTKLGTGELELSTNIFGRIAFIFPLLYSILSQNYYTIYPGNMVRIWIKLEKRRLYIIYYMAVGKIIELEECQRMKENL